MRGHICCCSCR